MPTLHSVEKRSGIFKVDAAERATACFRYWENNPGTAGGLLA
jgi:hypothetical protein